MAPKKNVNRRPWTKPKPEVRQGGTVSAAGVHSLNRGPVPLDAIGLPWVESKNVYQIIEMPGKGPLVKICPLTSRNFVSRE